MILPSLFLLYLYFLNQLTQKFQSYLFHHFLINILSFESYKYELPNQAFSEQSLDLYDNLNNLVQDGEYVAFYKPRLLRLATNINSLYLDEKTIRKNPDFIVLNSDNLNSLNNEIGSKYKVIKGWTIQFMKLTNNKMKNFGFFIFYNYFTYSVVFIKINLHN